MIEDIIDLHLDLSGMQSVDDVTALQREADALGVLSAAEEIFLTSPDGIIDIRDVPFVVDPKASYSVWLLTDWNAADQIISRRVKELSDDMASDVFLASCGGNPSPLKHYTYEQLGEEGIISHPNRNFLGDAFEWLGITPNRAIWAKMNGVNAESAEG